MLPIERLNRIKELIQVKQNMKISELSRELDVSEMTIHRDLKSLIKERFVVKTFGGISLVYEGSTKESRDTCVICNRSSIDARMSYRLFLPNNKIEVTCCAHCGLLRQQQLGSEVVQAVCHDFFRQTTISAPLAWYILDTTVDIGCCQPQVLTFEWKEHADKFVTGFGGKVYPFDEAVEVVFRKMNSRDRSCHTDSPH